MFKIVQGEGNCFFRIKSLFLGLEDFLKRFFCGMGDEGVLPRVPTFASRVVDKVQVDKNWFSTENWLNFALETIRMKTHDIIHCRNGEI